MIREDVVEFLKSIPKNITLVAATKYGDANDITSLVKAGVTNIGENRVDSFLKKYDELINLPINWHFIGHLQTNKAKKVINKIDCLHSLDSLELAKIIEKNRTKPLPCFVEVSINNEENKNGVNLNDIDRFISIVKEYKNINLFGLMMMSKVGSSPIELEKQFYSLVSLRDSLEKKFDLVLPYLSMGMSDDYLVAIDRGATHIRLGRILYKQ